jgi:NADH-quinone oxidoreductase subunit C
MTEVSLSLTDKLLARFGGRVRVVDRAAQLTLELAQSDVLEVMRVLRDEAGFCFEQLIDLCGVDYLSYGEAEWDTQNVSNEGFSRGVEGDGPGRFKVSEQKSTKIENRYAVVVHLLSLSLNQRLCLRYFATADDLPCVPSLTEIWPVANWFEREAYDLFGIVFEGHADLRRLLTDYGFIGHPFRKDFPLIGNVEVRYDPQKGRVVYEPVSIEPRVLVPRVVRDDSRYLQAQVEQTTQGK